MKMSTHANSYQATTNQEQTCSYLFRLGGMMNPKGYSSSVGRYSTNNLTKMCYKNNCIILSIGPFTCVVDQD